jgi:uncharacterized damage-inducible protein DinB
MKGLERRATFDRWCSPKEELVAETLPEPWLRGELLHLRPEVGQVLATFQQTREELARYTEGLTEEQLGERPYGLGSVAFHVQHLLGSIDRLLTYAEGGELSQEQFAHLQSEIRSQGSREALLQDVDAALTVAESRVKAIDASLYPEPRFVGRKKLPTTALGLLIHVSEHTQRHLGQAVLLTKIVRASGQK